MREKNSFAIAEVDGIRYTIRHLSLLDKLRLYKAAGASLSDNVAWMGLAYIAASIADIDGIPVPFPTTEANVEATIARISDRALSAISSTIDAGNEKDEAAIRASAGNFSGTLD